jgi:uncharacterized membrane protein
MSEQAPQSPGAARRPGRAFHLERPTPRANTAPHEDQLGLERIVFFSDAVMAIAITLLAVDIRVPEIARNLAAAELPLQLQAMAPKFTSFILSFAIIGVYWLAHHRYFVYIIRHDIGLILLNLLFLFFIVILPFVTGLLENYAYLPLANIVYALTAAALGLAIGLLWWYASRDHRLVDENLDPQLIRATNIQALSAPAVFLLSVPMALIAPLLAQITWALSPIVSIGLTSRLKTRQPPRKAKPPAAPESTSGPSPG